MSTRKRSNGTIELRITSKGKHYYSTHDTEDEAQRYHAHVKSILARGELPQEWQEKVGALPVNIKREKATQLVSAMIADYMRDSTSGIASSSAEVLNLLASNLTIAVKDITVRWVTQWITDMKRVDKLSPSTIRKRVEALARAYGWWIRHNYGDAETTPSNPLVTLPKGYSIYSDDDARIAGERKRDVERDRRLFDGEEDRIVSAISGVKRPDRQRAVGVKDREDLLLLFRVVVNTGLRLREAYTLRWKNISFPLKTIEVERSKTGTARSVPMTREVYGWLDAHLAFRPGGKDDFVFAFWDGAEDLDTVTTRLSARFASVFRYAGSEGITEHDLRHEATCRWMEMKNEKGDWLFRSEEVRKITGHKTERMFFRYLSLRGSDLAARLW